ncbi:MAG: hypothetical protein IPO15_21215 [Anaerolineae bacterium]|uniref:hypothetical protein n=1 Tax=Candidatus Amarolinea dominans TaxID=3140696 RepID=UPI0031350A90|nr:hypothetical protein [Anaerolineae bacterium]
MRWTSCNRTRGAPASRRHHACGAHRQPHRQHQDAAAYVEGVRKALHGSGFAHDPPGRRSMQVFNEPETIANGAASNDRRLGCRPSAQLGAGRMFTDAGGYPGIQVWIGPVSMLRWMRSPA